jgi:hypothetical protein
MDKKLWNLKEDRRVSKMVGADPFVEAQLGFIRQGREARQRKHGGRSKLAGLVAKSLSEDLVHQAVNEAMDVAFELAPSSLGVERSTLEEEVTLAMNDPRVRARVREMVRSIIEELAQL